MANKPSRITVPTPPSSERWSRRELTPGRKPWFRQDGETAICYADFMHFLMLPQDERTLKGAMAATGKSKSLMQKRIHQWSWKLRASAYDEHYLLLRLESVEADRDRMFREHRELTSMGLSIVGAHFQELNRLIAEVQAQEGETDEDGEPKSLATGYKPADIIRLFTEAIKADRATVLGRAEAVANSAEEAERLAEKHSDELAALLTNVLDEVNLSPEQRLLAKEVIERHLVLEGEERA